MRILIRTSKWAIWARRFGALALPLGAIPVLLHRQRIITDNQFVIIEAAALTLAALAVIAALVAFARLWFTGDQGWWKATLALVLGGLCLAPAAYFGWEAWHYPEFADVTTDFDAPPPLVSFVESRFIGPGERARIEAAYPNARSRNYPVDAVQMYGVVSDLVDSRGWEVRARREPQSPMDTGEVNVIAANILGFRQEIVIRVAGATDGSTVAMRSASLFDFPDFGNNGRRIEDFLLDLDTQVTDALRNAPGQPAENADANDSTDADN